VSLNRIFAFFRPGNLRRSTPARELLIFLAFIGLTVLMTWPWVMHLRDAVSDVKDPYFDSYVLWWDYHQTFHGAVNLFHANIFFPYRYTLAFSEHEYGVALLCFPLFALGLRPLTVHGIATLVGFAFSGYGAFRLARTLTGNNGIAWVTGIAFAFVPFRFGNLTHLIYLFSGWIPLVLEALVLFVREPTKKRSAWLGVAFFMNALTIHWFVLTLLPLGFSTVLLLWRHGSWNKPAFWRRGLAAMAVASIALIPFLLPYARAAEIYGFVRSPGEALYFSAKPIHWLVGDSHNKIWQNFNSGFRTKELELFPGLLQPVLALAAIFLITLKRLQKKHIVASFPTNGSSDGFWLGMIWLVMGFFGSLGMNFFFHRALFKYISLFRSLRAPVRWAMICYLGLALLAGLGAKRLTDLVVQHWPRIRPALCYVVIVLAILFEQRAAPLNLVRGAVDADALTLRLKETPMHGGIVELPAVYGAPSNYLYTLRAADHERPLVTAMSGFSPPIEQEIEALTHADQIPDRFIDLLESIPSSYLVVNNALLEPPNRLAIDSMLAKGLATGRLRFIRSYDESDLYALVRIEPSAKSEAEAPDSVRAAGAVKNAERK